MTIIGIDIGNTTISVALIHQGSARNVAIFETSLGKPSLEKHLLQLFKKFSKKEKIRDVVICSVVPKATIAVGKVVSKFFGKRPLMIGQDLKVPMANHYDDPKKVGADRLVGAYAAKRLYGAPTLVIDLGTAITFDVVSKTGAYEGGMIVPGIRLSAESLFQKTALLPRIDRIKSPRSIVGKNTTESILSGIFYGYGAMCSGIIAMMSKRFKRRPNVVVTGGHADLMRKFISSQHPKIDPHLVFKGLALIYQKSNPGGSPARLI